MAISTYSELQTAVANWLHRTDLTAIIPDFITLAESRINRNLRLNAKATESALTATVGSRYIALPSGFIEAEALWLTYYSPREKLRYVQASELPLSVSSGIPSMWTIDGTNIALDSAADLAYTFTLRNYQTLALSNSAPTNWLLTNHPDVYLYAALIESAPYIRDDDRVMLWKQAYDIAIQEVQDQESRSDSLATLSVESALINNASSNILEG